MTWFLPFEPPMASRLPDQFADDGGCSAYVVTHETQDGQRPARDQLQGVVVVNLAAARVDGCEAAVGRYEHPVFEGGGSDNAHLET
jgi:hypothetical protein